MEILQKKHKSCKCSEPVYELRRKRITIHNLTEQEHVKKSNASTVVFCIALCGILLIGGCIGHKLSVAHKTEAIQ